MTGRSAPATSLSPSAGPPRVRPTSPTSYMRLYQQERGAHRCSIQGLSGLPGGVCSARGSRRRGWRMGSRGASRDPGADAAELDADAGYMQKLERNAGRLEARRVREAGILQLGLHYRRTQS